MWNKSYLYSLAGVTAILLIWIIISYFSPSTTPTPIQVFKSIVSLFVTGDVLIDIYATAARCLTAYFLSLIIGIPVGLILGSSRTLFKSFSGFIDFLRSIPAFVLLPLFLVIFRMGETSRIAMATFGSSIVIIANTAFGASHIRPERIQVARSFGASTFYIIFKVIIFELLPQILDGLRIALSLVLILSVVGEIMLGATNGLGTRINDSLIEYNLSNMYALIILVGIFGYFINFIGNSFYKKISYYGKYL